MTVPVRPRLIVMPLRPAHGEAFDGTGLGLHFFLGNLFGAHPGLTECWFGWRVKKIFPGPGELAAYVEGRTDIPEFGDLGKQEGVRYWVSGTWSRKRGGLNVALALHDSPENRVSRTDIRVNLDDGLLDFRNRFFDWISSLGPGFPDLSAVSWPEHLTAPGLDCLGRAALATYTAYVGGADGKPTDAIDLTWFRRAVETAPQSYLTHDLLGWGLLKNEAFEQARASFETAIGLNARGTGALAGLMWCAIHAKDREAALAHALAKAALRRDDREKAAAMVHKKFS